MRFEVLAHVVQRAGLAVADGDDEAPADEHHSSPISTSSSEST